MHFFRWSKITTFPGTQKSLQAQIDAFIYLTYPEYAENISLDERTSHLEEFEAFLEEMAEI